MLPVYSFHLLKISSFLILFGFKDDHKSLQIVVFGHHYIIPKCLLIFPNSNRAGLTGGAHEGGRWPIQPPRRKIRYARVRWGDGASAHTT